MGSNIVMNWNKKPHTHTHTHTHSAHVPMLVNGPVFFQFLWLDSSSLSFRWVKRVDTEKKWPHLLSERWINSLEEDNLEVYGHSSNGRQSSIPSLSLSLSLFPLPPSLTFSTSSLSTILPWSSISSFHMSAVSILFTVPSSGWSSARLSFGWNTVKVCWWLSLCQWWRKYFHERRMWTSSFNPPVLKRNT